MPIEILAALKKTREWLDKMNITELTVVVTIDGSDSYTIVLRKR